MEFGIGNAECGKVKLRSEIGGLRTENARRRKMDEGRRTTNYLEERTEGGGRRSEANKDRRLVRHTDGG
jgi:hypothetical protein